MTDRPDLAALRALAEAATSGRWKVCGARGCVCGIVWDGSGNFPVLSTDTDSEHEGFRSTGARKIADAAYIAACSPERILALIGEVEDARRQVATQRCLCPEVGTSGSCPFHDAWTVREAARHAS